MIIHEQARGSIAAWWPRELFRLSRRNAMSATTTKCPVCAWEIKDDRKEVRIDGRVVLVCCDECALKIKTDPGKYIKGK